MDRNATGQYVSFLMVSATDGSGVTGLSPAVWVTKDGGSQTTGAGTVSELGNGQYRYLFTQAETDAGTVMVLAKGTGAINVSLTVYPEDAGAVRPANVMQIDGQATVGNNATLNLKMLSIVNAEGDAVVISGSVHSVNILHTGSSHGVTINNAPETALGTHALYITGGTNATAATLRVDSALRNAVSFIGGDDAEYAGLNISGGATAGNAVNVKSNNGHGVEFLTHGEGKHDVAADDWSGVDVAGVVGSLSESMEAIEAGLAAVSTNTQEIEDVLSGPGSEVVTLVVREPDGGAVIADAEVWLTVSGAAATPAVARGRTGVTGEVVFMLESGQTYYLWAARAGMNPIMGEAFVAE